MSATFLQSFGFKKQRTDTAAAPATADLTFEERAELFDDLLEDDASTFPLLDSPPEVLSLIGAYLEAPTLTALGEVCERSQWLLEDALADAWTALLLRDLAPRARAKRYRASGTAVEMHHRHPQSMGIVLSVVDSSRIEWDGMLVSSPPHLRYQFLQTTAKLKQKWGGRSSQCWEWFATRGLRRMTHSQLEHLVPDYKRPEKPAAATEEFDEVVHQASKDRDLRNRTKECNPLDVIASVKKSLGLKVAEHDPAVQVSDAGASESALAATSMASEDVLSALSPTARDQRLQYAQLQANAAVAAVASAVRTAEQVPSEDRIERMTFSEQLELALKISQASEDPGSQGPPRPTAPPPQATPCDLQVPPAEQEPAAPPAEDPADRVVMRLSSQPRGSAQAADCEVLEVALQELTVGDNMVVAEQFRRPLEQLALRLTRANWLLFYEGIAVEAQLRARSMAYHLRAKWIAGNSAVSAVRCLADLEPVLLGLPIFDASERAGARVRGALSAPEEVETQEGLLRALLAAWEEYEEWTEALGEHVGPLEQSIDRERANNVQGQGRANHTPHVDDLCRLAFRNFALCEGRLFFAVALALYGLVERLLAGQAPSSSLELLESINTIAGTYSVHDDSLALQRGTLQEYRYYILNPLKRAYGKLAPDAPRGGPEEIDDHVCTFVSGRR